MSNKTKDNDNYLIAKVDNVNPNSEKKIAIKDIHATINNPMTAGSYILKDFSPFYNSHVVQRLIEDNYNVVARVNMDEFAMGSSNKNPFYGHVSNAHDNDNISGGSSGGSAYAVAKGIVPVATGTDTGGSIRQPAALNGIYGLKPTYGLISRYGTVGFASSFDTIGMLGSNLLKLTEATNSLIKEDLKDQTSYVPVDYQLADDTIDPKKLKICTIKEFEKIEVDQNTKVEYQLALNKLKMQGYQIKEVSIDTIEYSLELYMTLAYGEASSNLSRFDGVRYGNQNASSASSFQRSRSLFSYEIKKRLILGSLILSSNKAETYFSKSQKIRMKMYQQVQNIFDQYDLIISPVTPQSIVHKEQSTVEYDYVSRDIFIYLANLTGVPALAIPLKKANDLHPVGMQIMAKQYQEKKILSFAKYMEGNINE